MGGEGTTAEVRRNGRRSPLASFLALLRGLAFFGVGMAGLALLVVPVLVPGLAVGGVVALFGLPPHHGLALALVLWAGDLVLLGYGVPFAFSGTRRLTKLIRRLSEDWLGVLIPEHYLAASDARAGKPSTERHRPVVVDAAMSRDFFWAATNASVGAILAVLPIALATAGLIGCIAYGFLGIAHSSALERVALGLAGAAVTSLAVWSAPLWLQAYGGLARAVLAPRQDRELAQRVQHLAQTRAETIDAGAAEIRRIERDLHDGTQARLVAMGMTLDAAENLLDTDPEATRQLLAEARAASITALVELRALVSGIHPPVLADRGLVDAIRALALDSVSRVEVTADTIARPSAPIESAAYFAVSELLTNVTKHADAREARFAIRFAQGRLTICVTDNGRGGADPSRGSGLRGIERRLAAFDGTLRLKSPPGGPTVVKLEIPCEL